MLSPPRSPSQSGNMLVYILGAIFLMGLLVVLVKGATTPGGGVDAETTVLNASEAQRYAAEIERAVAIILENGHSEADIRFSHANAPSAYQTTMDDPTTRQVFHPRGGAANFRAPPVGVNDGTAWQFYGNTHITDMGTDTETDRKAELIMVLPNVTAQFCNRINEMNDQDLDIVNDIQDPADDGCIFAPGSEFTGTFITGGNANVPDFTLFKHNPASQACIRCNGGGLHFYHVLMPR